MVKGGDGYFTNNARPRMEAEEDDAMMTAACACAMILGSAVQGERLPMGQFTAVRLEKSPVVDGVVSEGEWDRAFTTSGLMAPFEHELHESVTVMSLGYDDERLYFLFRCRRGDSEWKLWKKARLNDDYEYGDASVEIWVTPPALVPETYQNVINTYPAVMDMKMIPTRGYSGMGWKGNWKIGVREAETDYVIEASVPIRDFGPAAIRNGDVWRFLLCRTCHGAKPRAQASWSITQGFAEIPQHPPVRFMDDEAAVQFTGVHTIFTGKYEFEVGVAAPRKSAAEVDLELRFHSKKTEGPDDKVERKRISLGPGQGKVTTFSGDVTALKKGHFTLRAAKAGGTLLFRQSFPFAVTGWTPQAPRRPADAKVEELAVSAQYGPETNTILVKADIFDMPGRERAASGEVKVRDPQTGRVLAAAPLRPFRECYGGAEIRLSGVDIPVDDFRKAAPILAEARRIRAENEERKKRREPPLPIPKISRPVGRKAEVVVVVRDGEGKEMRSAARGIELLRYSAEWMDNTVGITDKVIPPWTPVRVAGGEVEVWNRRLSLDGLGLGRSVRNGGVEQLARPMRLVAVQGGREVEVRSWSPRVERATEAWADLAGSADAAGLKFSARTRVEFDGFVRVDLDVAPAAAGSAKVDRLYLEIALPAEEATHFCTTAGGWTAVHDALPDRWTSRGTASGMLVGDFVPYIWLTNSDRAFLWFADHDQGWNHDPDKALPTQEIDRKGGQVLLRVNFFEIPTEVGGPRTITWGWQVFPSKPLPKGWRATFCTNNPSVPHVTNTYFWVDADWAVLWPYYCSPFPWSMERSKKLLDGAKRRPNHRPCVGSIAHSIGRYRDYDGNEFPGLAVDWGATPGVIGNSDVTASKGPNDFRLWHYRRWAREAGFCGLYVDENYLGLEENTLKGNAYWRPDGRLQRAYNYLGLREYFKRLKVMFHQEGAAPPNLWQHVTGGAAYHAWLGDIFFEGENVEPTDLTFDYIEVLPAGRMRAIGSSTCAGGVMTMMCQSDRHRTQWHVKHTHQFVGWVMAHDILPEQVPLYQRLCEAGHLWEDGVRFLPYWKPGPFSTKCEGCLVSAHAAGDRVTLWVVNTSRKDADVKVSADWRALGIDPARAEASNAETGASIPLGADGFSVAVPQRDFVPVLVVGK